MSNIIKGLPCINKETKKMVYISDIDQNYVYFTDKSKVLVDEFYLKYGTKAETKVDEIEPADFFAPKSLLNTIVGGDLSEQHEKALKENIKQVNFSEREIVSEIDSRSQEAVEWTEPTRNSNSRAEYPQESVPQSLSFEAQLVKKMKKEVEIDINILLHEFMPDREYLKMTQSNLETDVIALLTEEIVKKLRDNPFKLQSAVYDAIKSYIYSQPTAKQKPPKIKKEKEVLEERQIKTIPISEEVSSVTGLPLTAAEKNILSLNNKIKNQLP